MHNILSTLFYTTIKAQKFEDGLNNSIEDGYKLCKFISSTLSFCSLLYSPSQVNHVN